MPQSDLSSFIPLSLLFIGTFLLPILIETSFTESETSDFITDTTSTNLRKSTMI